MATFDGTDGILDVSEFVFHFDIPLPPAELQRKFVEGTTLTLVKSTYNAMTNTWTEREMSFEDENGFTVQETIDAICESEKVFRATFLDPDHVYYEGLTDLGGDRFKVWWGS